MCIDLTIKQKPVKHQPLHGIEEARQAPIFTQTKPGPHISVGCVHKQPAAFVGALSALVDSWEEFGVGEVLGFTVVLKNSRLMA